MELAVKGELVYATYADGIFVGNYASNAWFFRWFGGARRTLFFSRRDLEASPIYAPHRNIFDAKRGAGYYAWKPWAILQAMDASGPDDVIFYLDCGKAYRYKMFLRPRELVAFAHERGFLAGVHCPQYGPNRRWNRRQCREIMGCTDARFETATTVEAVVSIWPNTAESRSFVETWLSYCLNYDAIRDASPDEIADEAADFIEHRYDQAVLTNLATLRDAPVLDVLPETLPFAKSATLLEIELRARNNLLYAMLHRAITSFGPIRRRLRNR